MAMRTSLLTYEKTAKKLEANRRFVKTQQILSNQIAAVIPAQGLCIPTEGQPVAVPSFLSGSADALRLISSYSIAEGARGYPQIVEYRVLPGERGGVRLVATEHPYTGPASTTPFCRASTASSFFRAAGLPPQRVTSLARLPAAPSAAPGRSRSRNR